MAKIQNLNVTTLKIADNAITEFFHPYSGVFGTDRYIDITYDEYDPVALIFFVVESGTTDLYVYNPSSELIHTVEGPANAVVGDSQPEGTYTYLLSSGTARITGALVRYR